MSLRSFLEKTPDADLMPRRMAEKALTAVIQEAANAPAARRSAREADRTWSLFL